MMNLRQLLLVLSFLLTAAAALPAQASEPWYEVELIVFRQADPGGSDRELHPLNPAPPQAAQVVSLRPPQAGKVAYTILGPAELKLGSIYQSLKSSSHYEPVLHLGWRQPGLASKDAASVALPANWQPWADTALPPLHGLVRLHQDRFIHLGVDLRYRHLGADTDAELAPTIVNRQSRRLRTGELHYLDRPGLGIVVQIRPLTD
jgi:hypothetical protein